MAGAEGGDAGGRGKVKLVSLLYILLCNSSWDHCSVFFRFSRRKERGESGGRGRRRRHDTSTEEEESEKKKKTTTKKKKRSKRDDDFRRLKPSTTLFFFFHERRRKQLALSCFSKLAPTESSLCLGQLTHTQGPHAPLPPPLRSGMASGTAAEPQGGFHGLTSTLTSTNPPPAASAASAAAAPSLSPADVHVLLVDDERMQRMVVASLLRKCSYKGKDEKGDGNEEIDDVALVGPSCG